MPTDLGQAIEVEVSLGRRTTPARSVAVPVRLRPGAHHPDERAPPGPRPVLRH
ncbi:hypothetical protein [Gordonia sp. OPL2]|uniref:hypothetical protein n=1 Tax=Gordonia sp. OPL2 TaxID=2486274 RepID=UPI00165617FC|nr:hypothetical protein [Gordonia sp. OPL2]